MDRRAFDAAEGALLLGCKRLSGTALICREA